MAGVLAIPFYKASIGGADTDSTSFRRKGIPAVTLSGLSNKWESIIHTNNDQVKAVMPGSVYRGYRLASAIWNRIDQAPCDAQIMVFPFNVWNDPLRFRNRLTLPTYCIGPH
jgi:hypothetical protein